MNAGYGGRFVLAPTMLAITRDLTTRRLKAVLGASFGYAAAASRLIIMEVDVAAVRALVLADASQATRMFFALGSTRKG